MKLRAISSSYAEAVLFLIGFSSALGRESATEARMPDAPGILYSVNTTSDTVVTGACQNGQAGCSLRGAIQTANSHPGADGILFDLPAGSIINLTQALPDLTEGVDLIGPGADQLTVQRDSGGEYRIFNVSTTGLVTLSGLTIRQGWARTSNGGGIQNASSGTVNVTSCVVISNDAGLNGSGLGGGIYNNSTGIVNVTNSTLMFNEAGNGGGIYNNSTGTVNVTNSTLRTNSAVVNGGGIYNNTGTVNVSNSTLISNNVINDGGGINNGSGIVHVMNSTLTGNIAERNGGGIVSTSGTVTISKSILSKNLGEGDEVVFSARTAH